VTKERVLQLGCGGAGSATAHALLSTLGAGHLALFDTDAGKAQALRDQLSTAYGADRVSIVDDAALAARDVDGIVNASPWAWPNSPARPCPCPRWKAATGWPRSSIFRWKPRCSAPRALGCATVSGQGMAVGQAADAFAIFTGQAPDRARMAASFAAFTRQG
jgi:shikimate dehydrogenase